LSQQELSSVTISPPNGYTGDAQFNLHVIIGDEGARHTVEVPFAVHVQAPPAPAPAPDPAPAPAPQADAVDDTPIDTAATLVMDDGGADRATTDEDSSVSGTLTIGDANAGQGHFHAATIDGNYGSFAVDETGQWRYTPDDRADTLNAGEQANDHFAVESADGSLHQVVIGLTGTDDAPQLAAAQEVGAGGTATDAAPAPLAPYLEMVGAGENGNGGAHAAASEGAAHYLDALGLSTDSLVTSQTPSDPADHAAPVPDADPFAPAESQAAEHPVDDALHAVAGLPEHEQVAEPTPVPDSALDHQHG
jgi:VCBS repeat-containing protein